jgi:hypothetical protein
MAKVYATDMSTAAVDGNDRRNAIVEAMKAVRHLNLWDRYHQIAISALPCVDSSCVVTFSNVVHNHERTLEFTGDQYGWSPDCIAMVRISPNGPEIWRFEPEIVSLTTSQEFSNSDAALVVCEHLQAPRSGKSQLAVDVMEDDLDFLVTASQIPFAPGLSARYTVSKTGKLLGIHGGR